MLNILVMDDDRKINEFLTIALEQAGFHVLSALDGEEGLSLLEQETIDLIVLDIMMPKIDGWEVASYVQDLNLEVPILMLSAKGQLVDKLKGFELGIADYLQKPFLIEELVARIRAILTRYRKMTQTNSVVVGKTVIDFQAGSLSINGGQGVNLPKKELDLLHYLYLNKGHLVSRDSIFNQVWGLAFVGDSRTIDVHIKRLRDKLLASELKIVSVRGLGYKLEVPLHV
ncbi:response regulator transcription factor [Vagococcus intermedius]|uniref:Heme response regulator HssR n=1 Tax=Vagococcus intermedius TaxID=2991418 RepID=A0AAF0CW05_9ENTE|nr:response regulator transcription factor [Vagococcus intermedius]WEG74004.1 response regulator transcription factor [Vagococcus intermedius]WEG76084.1 response regulator transcription factor [Vagococcus intermedius]